MSKKLICILAATTIISPTNSAVASSQHLLAFQGGGFRAMVAHSGLIAGALEYQNSLNPKSPANISPLLSNITLVSGNSAGTWFASCVAYSDEFVKSLEDYNNFFDKSKGYMGQVGVAWASFLNPVRMEQRLNETQSRSATFIKELFKHIPVVTDGIGLSEELTVALASPVVNWDNILTNTVFKPYNIASKLKNNNLMNSLDKRTVALRDRPLVYELSISTDRAALGSFDQVSPSARFKTVTTSTANNIGTDYARTPYKYIPATATSKGKGLDITAPALPTVPSGGLLISYQNAPGWSQPQPPAQIDLPQINFDGLSIFGATAISSAAGAIVDSTGSLYSNSFINVLPKDIVNLGVNSLKELAIPLKIKKSGSNTFLSYADNANGQTYPQIGSVTPQSLKAQPLLRFADGAYVDNTSVTSGMTYLQKQKLKPGFKITLFATYTEASEKSDKSDLVTKVNKNYQNLDLDTRTLFTKSGQLQLRYGFNASHPSAEIFDSSETLGLNVPAWQYQSADNKFTIKYYQLSVRTTQNNYGIEKGVRGSLDVWEVHTSTPVFPLPTQGQWMQYSLLYNNLRQSLTKDNGRGAKLLIQSLK